MGSTVHDTVLSVVDLLDAPGTSRRVDLELPVPDDFRFPLVTLRSPVRLVGVLESVVDGVLVRGELTATADLSCARCLAPVERVLTADVAELFSDPSRLEPGDEVEDGYSIDVDRIDVEGLLRDALAAEVPFKPLCRDDCAGLCATCGADLNCETCDCAADDSDPRWSALQQLTLPD